MKTPRSVAAVLALVAVFSALFYISGWGGRGSDNSPQTSGPFVTPQDVEPQNSSSLGLNDDLGRVSASSSTATPRVRSRDIDVHAEDTALEPGLMRIHLEVGGYTSSSAFIAIVRAEEGEFFMPVHREAGNSAPAAIEVPVGTYTVQMGAPLALPPPTYRHQQVLEETISVEAGEIASVTLRAESASRIKWSVESGTSGPISIQMRATAQDDWERIDLILDDYDQEIMSRMLVATAGNQYYSDALEPGSWEIRYQFPGDDRDVTEVSVQLRESQILELAIP